MKKYLMCLVATACLATPVVAGSEDQVICKQIEDNPGVYLAYGINNILKLQIGRQSEDFNPDAYVYVVPPIPQGTAEGVAHLRMTTMASDAKKNSYPYTKLLRNAVKSACGNRRDTTWQTQNIDSEIPFDSFDNFANSHLKNHSDLGEWHFRWNAASRGMNCLKTKEQIQQIQALSGNKINSLAVNQVSNGKANAITTKPSYAPVDRIVKSANMTSVLVHRPNDKKTCFAFRLPQAKELNWIPETTTIEYWDLGKSPRSNSEKTFVIKWRN